MENVLYSLIFLALAGVGGLLAVKLRREKALRLFGYKAFTIEEQPEMFRFALQLSLAWVVLGLTLFVMMLVLP